MPSQSSSEPAVSADDGTTKVYVRALADGRVRLTIERSATVGWATDLAPGAAAYLAGRMAILAGVQFDGDEATRRAAEVE